MTSAIMPFHLAIPVNCLTQARQFYGTVLACEQGRSSQQWVDWNFFGHQLVTHLVETMPPSVNPNTVDNKSVPVPHFGVVLAKSDWEATAQKLQQHNIDFVIAPYIRFKGKAGEQGTFFIYDPAGNALEFKYFNNMDSLFAQ
ncbi:MAG: VOC family protein [Glaciecola sp.]